MKTEKKQKLDKKQKFEVEGRQIEVIVVNCKQSLVRFYEDGEEKAMSLSLFKEYVGIETPKPVEEKTLPRYKMADGQIIQPIQKGQTISFQSKQGIVEIKSAHFKDLIENNHLRQV